tara:strand:- start:266 stop:1450 length:1185 start_codon:yes stop_codon:yes gene_type:complete
LKYLTILFLIIIHIKCYSLNRDSIANKTTKVEVISSFYGSVGSTHLPVNFFNKIYFGGFIDESEKGNSYSIAKNQRSGFETDMSFGVNIYKEKSELNGWYFSLQNKISAAGKYQQGLYDLFFRGNKNLNQQISLGNTKFHFRNHQLINFGKFYKNFSFGLAIGNILQEYNGIFGEKDLIDINNNYNWNVVVNPNISFVRNNNSAIKKNGNSFGLNFKINDAFNTNNLEYEIEIKNLGVMLLHSNIETINYDTSFSYSGLSFDQITNITNLSSEISTPFQPYTSNNKIISSTPFEVKCNVVKSINNLELFAGLFYRNNSQYLPKSYFGFNYRNKKKLNYGSNLSYGGYNKFQWGINTSYHTEKINVQIILQNCVGLIPSLGRSLGIVLNLNWKIR